MAKKSKRQWFRSDEVLGYIINAYAGVDPCPTNPHIMRRVFLWEEKTEIRMGNAEAFVLHLNRRFKMRLKVSDASLIHELLRDLGEVISPHRQHSPRDENSPKVGKFKQPDPDEWVVGNKPKK